jgi:4-hydroxyphenylpyruvate dioxygenase
MQAPTADTRRHADALGLRDVEHIEFYVGNAYQAMHFYRSTFGLTPIAYCGLETGSRERTSFVMERGRVRIVLTAPLGPDGPIAEHVRRHGDGVRDIAFVVDDVPRAYEQALARGARAVAAPAVEGSGDACVTKATIGAFGDTVHSFVQRPRGGPACPPGYQALEAPPASLGAPPLAAVDHVAIAVEEGSLGHWVDFYTQVLGFEPFHQEDIATELSAMNSKVVRSPTGRIKLPLMEPARGRRRSQIEEYLGFYGGAGAQHLALLSNDIVGAVRQLRAAGIEFLQIPPSYYDVLEARVGPLDEDVAVLRELNILVDRDASGYLMQVFTKPVLGRPTVFMEVIQRKGAQGFGGANVRALFEAVEREQSRRGTL